MRTINKIWIIFITILFCFLLLSPTIIGSLGNNESVPILEPDCTSVSCPRVAKPTGTGPYSTSYVSVDIPRQNGADVPSRIYYPSSGSGDVDSIGAPYSGIVWAPGAGGYETAYYTQLSTIASWGFIVAIVGTGGPVNQEALEIQSSALDYFEAENSNTSSIFFNNIDTTGYGASGHSNGGWAAIAGGVADSRYKGICPVMGAAGPSYVGGAADTSNLHVPLQLIAGSGDSTFLPSSQAYYDLANPIKSYIILQGSGHGGPFHLEYLISFYKLWLNGDKDYATFIYGDSIRQDIASEAVEYYSDIGMATTPSASKTSVAEDEEFTFSGEGTIIEPTDPGRTVVKYEWDIDNDGIYDWSSTTSPNVNHVYNQSGTYEATFKVEDSWGLSATSQISINVHNVKPTAVSNAGQTGYEDEVLYFDASDSYDTPSDLNSLQYRWDFDDYNTTLWQNESTTSHFYTTEGNYTVRVFVRDDDSEIDSDAVKVSIINVQPYAKISDFNQEIAIGELVTFNASRSYDSESDNDTLRYAWTFGDSKGAEGMTVTHSYVDEGEYIITLTVTDDDGAQSSAQGKIRIMNAVPYCSAMADQMLKEDELIILTGTGSDTKADENDLMYSWDLGVSGIPTTPWSNIPEFEYKYSNDGEYIATLTVKDDDSATASAAVNIYVENVEPNAKFSISSGKVNEDEPIIFDASTSTDTPSDVETLNYSWNFKDGTPTQYGKVIVHEFVDAGSYQVELTIMDDNDASDSYTKRVNVENVKPKADILASSKSIITGHVVSFSAQYSWDTPSDRDGLTFDWDFGDDSAATGVTALHNYTSPGSYTVSLTVTDDDGSQATAEFELRVNEFIGTEPEQTDDSEQQDDNSEYLGYAGGLVGALVLIFIILLLLYLLKSGHEREDEY